MNKWSEKAIDVLVEIERSTKFVTGKERGTVGFGIESDKKGGGEIEKDAAMERVKETNSGKRRV